jgi:hypothetical protein
MVTKHCIRLGSVFFLALVMGSCGDGEGLRLLPSGNSGRQIPDGDWLIPKGEVFDGGPGKDGIPSVDRPQFLDASMVRFLEEDDLLLGIKIGDEVRLYPHDILDWHEIVNDRIGNTDLAITYCPLTGTGTAWDRAVVGGAEFGVSGLLYQSNLIPYDRATDSYWSQMRNDCVFGGNISMKASILPMVETTWATWKRLYRDAKVLDTNTGTARSYGSYPYGSYKTSDNLLFPVSPLDERIPIKERVLCTWFGEETVALRFDRFSGAPQVLNIRINDVAAVAWGSTERNLMAVFGRKLDDGTMLEMAAIDGVGKAVMQDQEGNQWNIFGETVSRPRHPTKLPTVESQMGYWFSFPAFHSGVRLLDDSDMDG